MLKSGINVLVKVIIDVIEVANWPTIKITGPIAAAIKAKWTIFACCAGVSALNLSTNPSIFFEILSNTTSNFNVSLIVLPSSPKLIKILSLRFSKLLARPPVTFWVSGNMA